MKQAVVLASGGIDSSVAAALAVERYGAGAVLLLHQPYGSRQQVREEQAVRALAELLGCELRIIPQTWLGHLGGSSLTGEGSLSGPAVVVPGRNGLFLAVGVALAAAVGAPRVLLGAHQGDRQGFPDCRSEFLKAADTAATLGYGVTIEAPFVDWQKSDIIREGNRLGVPWGLTYSCYAGTEPACGICEACWSRRQAFAGVTLAAERAQVIA